jgi:cobalt-zinc-cadmium efflux system membrane fusion protein
MADHAPGGEPRVGETQTGAGLRHHLLHALPTALVLAVLGGVALWGHYTGWTLPKFSMLIGGPPPETEDWCQEHGVLESGCIECRPDLLPPLTDHGWCREHGISQCPLHHPDIAQLKATPTITPEMLARAQRGLTLLPRSENNSRCTLYRQRIQFASLSAIEKAGVDVAVVLDRPVVEAIEAPGELIYDQTRLAHLSSRVPGTAWRVDKNVGDAVRQGDVLALIDSVEVGRVKSTFMQAIVQLRLDQLTVDRLRPLAQDKTVAVRQFREAEAALEQAVVRLHAAQQALVNLGLPVNATDFEDADAQQIAARLRYLGLPTHLVNQLDAETASSNLYPVRAPLAGVVIERDVVNGEVVHTDDKLFAVADVARLWLMLSVRQEDARHISLGQTVRFRPNDSPAEEEVTGSVDWISTSADHQTRTVQVRVQVPNADGRLRANSFGTGRIVLREEPQAIVVPSQAVHWDGTCHVVFVRDKRNFEPDSPKFFHVRSVRPGARMGDMTEIIVGLLPGEIIASRNSAVLAAQLLKSNLGAGCCEVHTK